LAELPGAQKQQSRQRRAIGIFSHTKAEMTQASLKRDRKMHPVTGRIGFSAQKGTKGRERNRPERIERSDSKPTWVFFVSFRAFLRQKTPGLVSGRASAVFCGFEE
jgi:hypothetical protein